MRKRDHSTPSRRVTNVASIQHEANSAPPSRAINGILAMPAFKNQFATSCRPDICNKDLSIIVAILSAGTVLGALLAAPAGDSLGRRITLLIGVGVFCIGAICQVCANAVPLLLVGRYARHPRHHPCAIS